MSCALARPRRSLCRVLALSLCLALSGCGDEQPAAPAGEDAWSQADLPLLVIGTNLESITFTGDTGYILGTSAGKVGTAYLLLMRDPERHWVARSLVDVPDNAVLLDIAAGARGLAVGGYLMQLVDPCLVYDERGVAAAAIARGGERIAAIDGDDELMVAAGSAIGGALWASRTPGTWSNESTPLSQFHNGGFTDVFVAGGSAWACGFDGGSDTPPVVVALDPETLAWSKVPLGAGILGHELRCVAAGADGSLLLGGIVGTGGAPRPFLRLREPDGAWYTLTIPDAEFLGDVNDVLPAGAGSWLVACGGGDTGGMGTILRVTGRAVTREMTPYHGAILQLARDADGLLHAVGYRLSAGASLHLPLMLTRD